MVKISKVLNNNAVIIKDQGQEKIAMGTGVGFEKGKNDTVNQEKIEKLFVLNENEKLQQLLERIPEEHLSLTEEIIRHAEKSLDVELGDHILLALTDHISFAIERAQEGIHLQNKLLQEIKILYHKEFEIGLWGLQLINERMAVNMPVDEAAFIALHLHTMKIEGGDVREVVKQTSMIRDMVDTIKNTLNIEIQEEDVSYDRLIAHLRFALVRATEYDVHSMDRDILKMIKKKYTKSFNCAKLVADQVYNAYGVLLPEEEQGYIALHIERLQQF